MENTSSTPAVQSVIINDISSSLVPETEPTRPETDENTDTNFILNTSIDSNDQDEIGHMIIYEDPLSPVYSNEGDSNEDISDISSNESEVGDDNDYDVNQYMNLRLPRAFEDDQNIELQETVNSKDEI